jgi:two-component system CheB/CheR fusion protein
MAFILVQHMDPTHESMLVELLSNISAVPVTQASDGMVLAVNHLYVIPPGLYLSLNAGILNLSVPLARHGARLPFDFLLQSLAASAGSRAVCVILSGSGADGTLGLQAIKAAGGLVMVQAPDEAAYDGMPRSAIATGQVDFVLPVEDIAKKLSDGHLLLLPPGAEQSVARIVALLHERTPHDFTLYKTGTLQRRITRRMAISGVAPGDTERYLTILQGDQAECDVLAEDMLINVTGFFRDPKTFEMLAKKIIPGIVAETAGRPIRIWVAGCSTGEETFSLAMLFLERLSLAKSLTKLQMFASDVDEQAIKAARDGFYPLTIEASVSPERLTRFFTREEQGYRISADLRGNIVFAVQDVLSDPPFSKLDLISCRNLLIYLRPEAQAKIASIFHFALREGGLLLLGNAEAIGAGEDRFAVVAKSARLYRRVGGGRAGYVGLSSGAGEGARLRVLSGPTQAPSRPAELAELCRSMVLESYGPAAVLINRKFECLHFQGPIDRYLKVAPGRPAHDLIAMAREGVRARLRSVVQRAVRDNARIAMLGGRINGEAGASSFRIVVEPAPNEHEDLLLVCFVDEPKPEAAGSGSVSAADVPRVRDLERELEATKVELQSALRSLETSSAEQMAINEEALSANEEFQSTNEELLASKEELQSLNEELNALNGQLQETLERQRTSADDLQNVLYSTDVATIFLDTRFNIRFFTPATRALFNVIPGDVKRC